MSEWKTIYEDEVGMRHVKVDKGNGSLLRARILVTGTAIEIEIDAATPGQLKQRLVEDGEFSEQEASAIIEKVMMR